MQTTVIVFDDRTNFARQLTIDDASGEPKVVDMRFTPHPGAADLDPREVPFFAQTLDLLQAVGATEHLAALNGGQNGREAAGPTEAFAPVVDGSAELVLPPGFKHSATVVRRYQAAHAKFGDDPAKMAKHLNVSKATMSGVVSNLRHAGLLPHSEKSAANAAARAAHA